MALTGLDESDITVLEDRSWELLDHGAFPPKASHSGHFLHSHPLRDTGSIPIALFNSRIKREILPESVRPVEADEGEIESPWEEYTSERNLGDGLAGEPIAAKQVATMFYAGPKDGDVEEVTLAKSNTPLPGLTPTIPATRPRRMSTRLAQASGSNRDPITIDEEEEEDSDNTPATKRPRNASRPSTGGKVPKTFGGKSVARKATAGKGVRKTTGGMTTGGKAPRTGRRKSIAE